VTPYAIQQQWDIHIQQPVRALTQSGAQSRHGVWLLDETDAPYIYLSGTSLGKNYETRVPMLSLFWTHGAMGKYV